MTVRISGVGRFSEPRASTRAPTSSERATASGENAMLEAMADVLDVAAIPFGGAPRADAGALVEVQRCVASALSPSSAPESTPASAGLPAAVIGLAVHVGTPHTHTHPPSLVPPAPAVPLPSIGTVMMAGAVNVLINGAPAARAGDIGIAITCGSLAPPLEITHGSSSVLIGGKNAARVGDMTRHCNPTVVGAVGGGILAAAQAAADASALALQAVIGSDPAGPPGVGAITVGSGNVMIGGAPAPNQPSASSGLLRAAKGMPRKAEPSLDVAVEVGAAIR